MPRKPLFVLAAFIIAAFAALMLTKTLPCYTFEKGIHFLTTESDATNDNLWFRMGFYVHITTSLMVLALGLLQWLPFVAGWGPGCTAGWATATWRVFGAGRAPGPSAGPLRQWRAGFTSRLRATMHGVVAHDVGNLPGGPPPAVAPPCRVAAAFLRRGAGRPGPTAPGTSPTLYSGPAYSLPNKKDKNLS